MTTMLCRPLTMSIRYLQELNDMIDGWCSSTDNFLGRCRPMVVVVDVVQIDRVEIGNKENSNTQSIGGLLLVAID